MNLSPLLMDILYDPQTSGGLLISLPLAEAGKLVGTLKKEENIDAYIVGEVVEGPQGKIQIL
jgi:selenide,water dikinase